MTLTQARKICEQDMRRKIKIIDHARLKHDVLVLVYSSRIDVPDMGKVMYELRCSTFHGDRRMGSVILKTIWRKA